MALDTQQSLNPGVRRRELFGWAMYDFANSGYTTVVLTAVFAAYFVGGVAGGASWATLAWTVGLSISYAIVMLTMPGLGAWADRHAAKKRLLMAITLGCVASTATLAWVQPGQVALGLVLLVVSNTFYSWGESLTAAFLPELARPEAMGRVSGWGWALGYVGGMLTLGICLAYVLSAQARQESASQFVPVTMLITAGLYGAASLVTFALLREHARPQAAAIERGGADRAAAGSRMRIEAVEVGNGVAVDEAQDGFGAEEFHHARRGLQEGAGAGLVETFTKFVAQVIQRFVDGLDDAGLDGQRIARQPHPATRPGGGAAELQVLFRDDDFEAQVGRGHGGREPTGPGADHQQVAVERGRG